MSWVELATPLIQKWESFKPKAYLCPAGVWTVGWGSTGTGIGPNTVWSREQADRRFLEDLTGFGRQVDKVIKVALEAHQKAAVVSLAYNIGMANLKSSTLLRKINAGDMAGAALEFKKWNKARVSGKLTELRGLTNRRAEEAAMFRGG